MSLKLIQGHITEIVRGAVESVDKGQMEAGHSLGLQQHQVTIDSNRFAGLDNELIPTGNILDVSGTPFDFHDVN